MSSIPITPAEAKAFMEKQGFYENYRAMNGNEISSITFLSEEQNPNSERHRIPPFGCTVYMKDQSFEFFYAVPHSINKLTTPKCSPVTKQEHFDNICAKFEQQVKILARYCSD